MGAAYSRVVTGLEAPRVRLLNIGTEDTKGTDVLREAVETALRCSNAGDWPGAGTANMDFHMAVVELADSERLNLMFAPVLAELRLAFGLMQDAEFLHAPYVDMNAKILELAEAGQYAQAAAALQDYLVHSERIVLAVYARRIADAGWEP